MSNYWGVALNPKTGRWQEAEFMDDALGPHHYGVRFRRDDDVHDIQEIQTANDKDPFAITRAQLTTAFYEWADKWARNHANDLSTAEFLNEITEVTRK